MIPDQLRRAAQTALQQRGPLKTDSALVQPGEIGVAVSRSAGAAEDQVVRIVAVVAKDEATATAVVQIATNEVENATDLDLIVSPDEVDLPFALAIEGELYGPVFSDQLDRALGSLETRHLEAIRRSLLTDGESLEGHRTGAPLAGNDDPRRAFKERELDDLDALTHDCRLFLSGARYAEAVIDPRLLVPPPTGTARDTAEDQFIELLDAVVALDDGPIEIPSEFLQADEDLVEEILRWRVDFGLDASRVLTRVRITEVESLPVERSRGGMSSGATSANVPHALQSYLEVCAEAGQPVVEVQSVHRCWGDDELVVIAAVGGRYCRGRAHMPEAA